MILFNLLGTIDRFLDRFCIAGLIFSVSTMLFFSILTIVLRWFGITYMWFDPLVRHLVFFSAFLGGALASSRASHIKIDIFSKILETAKKDNLIRLQNIFIHSVSLLAVIWLAKASYQFAQLERQFGKEAFLGIHSGSLVMLIPIGLGLIGYRTFYQILRLTFKPESHQ
jgi:TRAP-type C4-dicarboxylate transport system permease small subunit